MAERRVDILDINPVLGRRRQALCEHACVLIDPELAEAECEACGKLINPYWLLDRFAEQWDDYARVIRDHEATIGEEHRQRVAMMNHRTERLRAEIETLEAKKRQLMTEQVAGQALGQQVKRWKRPRSNG